MVALDREEIGSRILDLRKKSKLSREEVSEKIGISTSILKDIEYGEFKDKLGDIVEKMANLFNKDISYFMVHKKRATYKKKTLTDGELLSNRLINRWGDEDLLKPLAISIGILRDEEFINEHGEFPKSCNKILIEKMKPYIDKLIREKAERDTKNGIKEYDEAFQEKPLPEHIKKRLEKIK